MLIIANITLTLKKKLITRGTHFFLAFHNLFGHTSVCFSFNHTQTFLYNTHSWFVSMSQHEQNWITKGKYTDTLWSDLSSMKTKLTSSQRENITLMRSFGRLHFSLQLRWNGFTFLVNMRRRKKGYPLFKICRQMK